MARSKLTISLPPDEIDRARQAAEAEGVTLSDYVAQALREQHYRELFARAAPEPLPDETELRNLLKWQADPAA